MTQLETLSRQSIVDDQVDSYSASEGQRWRNWGADNSIASESVRRVGSNEIIETLEPWSKDLQQYGARRLCH